ncbi:competence type IV pilus major pilin ComGC [Psychrobacillus sp. OK032]|uniref:competence type IV pilus major pilin ComGC n=1 Tax=Psychrobacillus sp. OK032 TaxID=1884358 RepID=UPI0008C2F406|nr:competence type IV pilus major pilin ComGC [Psychrobacillus sp. OK032]SER81011.1 competence protein ComGC [Psychrobacillus sp. OK032]
MKKIWKDQRGFTLVEMMIVLLIISVLILISIPNVTKHSANIDKKGCEAFVKMVEGQVEAYKIEHKKFPTIAELMDEGYLKGIDTCPNGDEVEIGGDGIVVVKGKAGTGNGEG